jgi:hypothetical protein
MIILSVGMQKSGSGLLFNLTNDLLIHGGFADIRKLREIYDLVDFTKHHNCNIGEPANDKMARLQEVSKLGHSFVVKTHGGINATIRKMIVQGQLKATVIYRDPRDVVVSAMDHGKKIRDNGENHSFASCTTLEITAEAVKGWLNNSIMTWLQFAHPNILIMRYEDLITRPDKELQRLCQFLSIKVGIVELLDMFEKYNPGNLDEFMKDYLHFNEGKTERYKNVLSAAEIEYCNHSFVNYFTLLGYSAS